VLRLDAPPHPSCIRGLYIYPFSPAPFTSPWRWRKRMIGGSSPGFGAPSASYPMGTRCSFPGGKVAGTWSWLPPPSSAEVKECVELYLHFPNTPSWRGAWFK
jgi:hypothetical protein